MLSRLTARRWLFRIAALVLVPLLLLAILETGLRLAGYGYQTSFFKPVRIGGQDFLVENDKFGLRFFPPELARSPVEIRMRAQKEAGAIRIFILGESAAMGDPEPAYGAWRYLEVLLRQRYPNQRFEFVNLAMTAINSHVILPIARECATQNGDLWIIYMGNNEMVGPFGAATVFGPKAPPLGTIRLNIALQKTRVGQLAAALARKIKGASTNPPSWAGMEMFTGNRVPPMDPQRERVYEHFQRNLREIIQAGLSSGARVLLNSVAVNLRDCPPFASCWASNAAPSRAQASEATLDAGRKAEQDGNLVQAATAYQRACESDRYSAELHYRWAECLLHLTNCAQAQSHFQLACDYDALPFRADSHINAIVAQTGKELAGPKLRFLDAAAILGTNNPCGLPGQETFYEHVHFNFDGNYRLALAWADEVAVLLADRLGGRPAPGWATQEACERRLGLSVWNRGRVLRDVIQRLERPPLSQQSNNAQRVADLEAAEQQMAKQMDRAGAARAHADFVEAVNLAPEDHYLRQNFANFLGAVHDTSGAIEEWKQIKQLVPHNVLPYFAIGRLFALENKNDEAEAYLTKAGSMRADFIEIWFVLSQLHINESRMEEALQDIGRAQRLRPSDPHVYFEYGRAYSKMGREAEAVASYRHAIQLQPDYWEAHAELGGHLGQEGNADESRKEFEEVVHLKPDLAVGHFNLGFVLMKQGHVDEARRQLEEAARLDPKDSVTQEYLKQLR